MVNLMVKGGLRRDPGMETCFFSQKGLLPPLRAVKSRDTLKGTEQGSAFPPRSLHSPHSKPHSPMTQS